MPLWPSSDSTLSWLICGAGAFLRNIFSIRPVTTYPPTTFAPAKTAATKPRM